MRKPHDELRIIRLARRREVALNRKLTIYAKRERNEQLLAQQRSLKACFIIACMPLNYLQLHASLVFIQRCNRERQNELSDLQTDLDEHLIQPLRRNLIVDST